MKVLVTSFEKRSNMLEDNLHSAKEGLDGAKARIAWLESKIEQVTRTNDRRTPAEGTALESTSVVETPPPPRGNGACARARGGAAIRERSRGLSLAQGHTRFVS